MSLVRLLRIWCRRRGNHPRPSLRSLVGDTVNVGPEGSMGGEQKGMGRGGRAQPTEQHVSTHIQRDLCTQVTLHMYVENGECTAVTRLECCV